MMPWGLMLGFALGAAAMYALHENQRHRALETVNAQFAAVLAQPGLEADRARLTAARDAAVAELEMLALFTGPQRRNVGT